MRCPRADAQKIKNTPPWKITNLKRYAEKQGNTVQSKDQNKAPETNSKEKQTCEVQTRCSRVNCTFKTITIILLCSIFLRVTEDINYKMLPTLPLITDLELWLRDFIFLRHKVGRLGRKEKPALSTENICSQQRLMGSVLQGEWVFPREEQNC